MAIAFPPVYLSCAAANDSGGSAAEPRAWRLSPDRVLDLRDVALGVEESRAGVGCRYLIDHLAGGGGNDVDEDGYVSKLVDLEKFVDRFAEWGKHEAVRDWRTRLARCRRAIAALRTKGDHKSANVLMVAYGPRDPSATDLYTVMGPELSALAKYVDAVEAKRLEMAREEARSPANGVWKIASKIDETGRLVWEWFKLPKDAPVDMHDFGAKLERAKKSITSDDALRAATAAFADPVVVRKDDEGVLAFEARKATRKERQAAHKERLDAFLREVKSEARAMLLDAERRYWAVWLTVATERA